MHHAIRPNSGRNRNERFEQRKYGGHICIGYELEGRLDARTFLRPHRSILVNVTRVVEVVKWFGGTYALKLADGTRIPVARRRAKQIREALAI